MPDPTPARKSSRRLGLYLPFGLLVIVIVGWCGAWLWLRGEVERRVDAARTELGKAGYELAWTDRKVSGFPYRFNVTLTAPSVRDASGWALAAPKLEAQSYMLSLGRWMIAAPQGLSFTRPQGGPVNVSGQLIRASLSRLNKHPPNLSFEGVKLAFAPAAGAQPFALTGADRVEFHLRAGPDDEGGVFAKVEGGKARLSGLFARIADGKPVAIAWNATFTKASALQGATWREAVRAWTAAGGQIKVRDAGVTAGDAVIGARAGSLTVGSDGRLRGTLDLSLRQAPRTIAALGDTGAIPPEAALGAAVVAAARQKGDIVSATVTFQAGRTTLGPVAIAPAPRVY